MRLDALGWPMDRPVFAAVDSQIAASAYPVGLGFVRAYAAGIGRPAAVYGPAPFVEWCLAQGVHGVAFACASSEGPYPTLAEGASGPLVVQLQRRLAAALKPAGLTVAVDGVFDLKTAAAVRLYQGAEGLTVDGIVGQETWLALSPAQLHQTTTQRQLGGTTADVDYAIAADYGQAPKPATDPPPPDPTPGGEVAATVPPAVATLSTDPTGQTEGLWLVQSLAFLRAEFTDSANADGYAAMGVGTANLTSFMSTAAATRIWSLCEPQQSI
jgi:hypothetical protein